MTYRNVLFDGAIGQQSTEPHATDAPPSLSSKSGHAMTSRFFRPDPEVLSEAIPVYFIGRNRDGLWVAREAEGRCGGLFWFRQAAIRFAKTSARPAGCATVFLQGRFELDIKNSSNALVAHLGFAKRLLTHPSHLFVIMMRRTSGFQRRPD